jgi:hypothetical protein
MMEKRELAIKKDELRDEDLEFVAGGRKFWEIILCLIWPCDGRPT